MTASALVFAFGYGSLSKDVEQIKAAMVQIQARDITPGAQAKIGVLEAKQAATDRDIARLRDDSADFRAQIRAQLDRIESKLDAHLDGSGRRER